MSNPKHRMFSFISENRVKMYSKKFQRFVKNCCNSELDILIEKSHSRVPPSFMFHAVWCCDLNKKKPFYSTVPLIMEASDISRYSLVTDHQAAVLGRIHTEATSNRRYVSKANLLLYRRAIHIAYLYGGVCL
jgi:hypothetical protein